jgi:hypothetical protein
MIAKGAHSVIAQGMPTTPTTIVARVGVGTIKAQNMDKAKRTRLIIQARRRLNQGITRLSKNLSIRVVYDFWEARLRIDIALEDTGTS